jgi:hypothetical protein
MIDSAWIDGAKCGFNLGIADNRDGFHAVIAARQKDIKEAQAQTVVGQFLEHDYAARQSERSTPAQPESIFNRAKIAQAVFGPAHPPVSGQEDIVINSDPAQPDIRADYMQIVPGSGVCFEHGPYPGSQCPDPAHGYFTATVMPAQPDRKTQGCLCWHAIENFDGIHHDQRCKFAAQPEQGSVDNPETWKGIGEAYDKPTIAQPDVEAAREIAKRLTQKLVDEGQQFKDRGGCLQWPGSAAIEQAIVKGAEAFAASQTATLEAKCAAAKFICGAADEENERLQAVVAKCERDIGAALSDYHDSQVQLAQVREAICPACRSCFVRITTAPSAEWLEKHDAEKDAQLTRMREALEIIRDGSDEMVGKRFRAYARDALTPAVKEDTNA